MTVLVTGATGLLGAHLVRRLNREGIRPRALLRERSDLRGLSGTSYEPVRGDVLDAGSLARAAKGSETVFHLAGSVRFGPKDAPALEALHIEGTRNVVRACRQTGARRLIHVSSVAALGYGPLNAPATEETLEPFDANSAYHATKRAGEQVALAASGQELEVVVANPAFVVGAYDVRPSSGLLLIQIAHGRMALFPSGGNGFVNGQDVAEGLWLLWKQGRAGERYILNGENLTYRQFFSLCAQEANVSPPRIPLSDGLLQRISRLADRFAHHLPNPFDRLSGALLRTQTLTAYYSARKAMLELGYRPTPVRVGVREAYRWFQEEGYLARDRPLSPTAAES